MDLTLATIVAFDTVHVLWLWAFTRHMAGCNAVSVTSLHRYFETGSSTAREEFSASSNPRSVRFSQKRKLTFVTISADHGA